MNIDSVRPNRQWILGTALLIATLLSQLSNLAYQSFTDDSPFSEILLPSIIFITLLTVPSLLIGFKLGKQINVGLFQKTDIGYFNHPLTFAVIAAVLLGFVLLGIRHFSIPYLPEEIPQYGFRGVWGGFFVSLGAAIGEEIWFRFGLMTLLLWLAKRLLKLQQITGHIALIVIVLTGIAFGAAHLPQLLSYGAGTNFAIWGTLLGNIAVSILYGWCFWRLGLVSAMAAHFTLDIILHVLPAINLL